MLTKPLHSSQRAIGKDDYGVTIELTVQLNFELEKEILALGEGVMVLKPSRLKQRILNNLTNAVDIYSSALSEKGLLNIQKMLEYKGFGVVHHMYTTKVRRQLGSVLNKAGLIGDENKAINLTKTESFPQLRNLLMSRNLERFLMLFPKKPELGDVVFQQTLNGEEFSWHQHQESFAFRVIHFLESKQTTRLILHIISGSHKKLHSKKERDLIVENSVPVEIELQAGSALILNPYILHQFDAAQAGKKFRLLKMDFTV